MKACVFALALGVFGGLGMTAGAEAATAKPAAAAHDPPIAVVQDMVQAWNTRNWDRVTDLFAEDGSLYSMMLQPVTGRAAIGARIHQLGSGISQIRLNVKHIGLIDGVVYVERVDEFTYKGHTGAVPVVGAIEVKNGKVQVWREYYDRNQLLRAMGLPADFDGKSE